MKVSEVTWSDWSAFWMKLKGEDLRPYNRINFNMRADPNIRIAERIKIELKRDCRLEDEKFICNQTSIFHVSGITDQWQQRTVRLVDFGPTDYTDPISSFDTIEELIFVFEKGFTEPGGVV